MPTRRLSLPSVLASRDATGNKDGLLTNCYCEKTPIGDMIVKRPGYAVQGNTGTGCAQGAVTFNGQALFIKGDAIQSNFQPFASGTGWTGATSPPKPTNGVGLGSNGGGMLVSLGGALYALDGRDNLDGSVGVYKSTNNGATWATIATSVPWGASVTPVQAAVAYGGRMYIIATTTTDVWSSVDGIAWTKTCAAITLTTTIFTSNLIVHNGLMYAFFGRLVASGGARGEVYSSPDGVAWTSQTTSAAWAGRIRFGAHSYNGNLYVSAGIAAANLNDVWKSTDNGVTWTQITAAAAFSIRSGPGSLTYAGKMWILGGTAVSDVYSSTDGITWTLVTAGAGWAARSQMAHCTHNGTMYVGPGQLGGAMVASLHYASAGSSLSTSLSPAPPTLCQPYQIALIPANGATLAKAFIKNNSVAYVYDGSTITKVTDANYPTSTVSGVAYLDGVIYVMDAKGIIYGSNLLDPLTWNALNFITANAEADAGVAIARQLNYILAFKDYSTEVFYDAGNPTGSALGKVQNALIEIGLAAAGSLAFSDNTIYFMANSRQRGRTIMKMVGYTPQPISTPFVDRILNGDDLATVYAFVVKTNGHFFYVLTLKTSGVTLVFDEMTGEWHRWTTTGALSAQSVTSLALQSDGSILANMPFPHGQSDGDVVTILGAAPAEYNGQVNLTYNSSLSTSQFKYQPVTTPASSPATGSITATFYQESYFPGAYYAKGDNADLLLDETSGNVYTVDPAYFRDNGNPINTKIRTAIEDYGTNKAKFFTQLTLIGDNATTTINERHSDDDYQTWSRYRPINAGRQKAQIRRLGRGRRRSFEFRHTDNTPLRLIAAEIEFEVGSD